MEDRELLLLAARANWAREVADDEISLRYCEINDGVLYLHADNQDHNGADREFRWNPLEDDGDALRLAVRLGILLRTDFPQLLGELLDSGMERYAATRRAITRIAAEIGKRTTRSE